MGLSGACFLDTLFVAGKLLVSHWEEGWNPVLNRDCFASRGAAPALRMWSDKHGAPNLLLTSK